MQLINKIDQLIIEAKHIIIFIENETYKINSMNIEWNQGFDRGYISAVRKYVDDLINLKNILIEIQKDDDDV